MSSLERMRLERAIATALALRALRAGEMSEARRWKEVFGRATDDHAMQFMARHIGTYVAEARKLNRQMICEQKRIRDTLARRTRVFP